MKLTSTLRYSAVLALAVALTALDAPAAQAQAPPAMGQPCSVTANPLSGVGNFTSTITWLCPVGVTVAGTDAWSGAKAATGSQAVTVSGPSGANKYGLSYTPSANGSGVLTWSAPDKNTDGSALTDLAGFKAYHGTSSSALTDVQSITSPSTRAYTFQNLAPGTHYFAVTSLNSTADESALSAIGNKVVPAPTPVSSSVTITKRTVPMPPTNLTIEVVQGVAFSPAFRILQNGERAEQLAGFLRPDVQCAGPVVFTYRGRSYRKVPSASVLWWNTPATDRVAAACS